MSAFDGGYGDATRPSDSALEQYYAETVGLGLAPLSSVGGDVLGTRSTLGSTELADADSCERRYWLRYVRRLVPKVQREDRLLGTLIHVCLRYWYAQFLVGGPPAWFYARDLYAELNRVGVGYPRVIEQAKIVFDRYLARWADEDRAWKVLAIEEEYGVRLGDLFGIYATQTREEQAERARSIGLCGAAIQLRPDLGDLDVRPTIRLDLAVERSDGVQFEMDAKSTVGRYRVLPKWTDYNEFGLGWQPYEYLHLGRAAQVTSSTPAVPPPPALIFDGGAFSGPAAAQLVFPNLAAFIVQRIQTVDPYQSDRNFITITTSMYSDVPRLIARQVAKRRRLRLAILDNEYPPDGPMGSPWACWGRGVCDYFYACRNENREGVLSSSFVREEP